MNAPTPLGKPLLMIQAERLAEALPPLHAAIGEASDRMLEAIGPVAGGVVVVPVYRGAPLPRPDAVSAVVVTGAAAMVADPLPWIGETADFLRAAVGLGVPTLGVCFGHQLLASALGGSVAPTPSGPEYATITVETTAEAAADPLFAALAPGFAAQGAHFQTVTALPPGATMLARGASGVQAFRVGNAWGVQFHPEFPAVATEVILRAIAPRLEAHGIDVAATLAAVGETPAARTVLARFGEVVRARAAVSA